MIIRTCLCIPTYNNPKTLESVVLDCLTQTSHPILIVDDGSYPKAADALCHPKIASALKSQRLRIRRLEKNQGKGRAIQEGFQTCVKNGFTHMLTLDADGQHLASEIPKLTTAVCHHPWDLIIGKRRFNSSSVPSISKFGRKFSNFWVKYQTGQPVSDSQSGFRIYPLFQVQLMRFWTKRFDFEIEVLIRLLWKNVAIREVEMEVYYPKASERLSHFNKFTDNVRISLLNVLLVVLSLFRSHLSPLKIGLSTGIGVGIGCSPFFGFHTIFVGIVAFLCRLNAGLMFLGSQISIPPLAPLLVIASITVGFYLSGDRVPPHLSLETAALYFWRWLLGSLVVGSALGLLIGGLSTLIARKVQSPPKRLWTGRTRGGKFGNWLMIKITVLFGLRAGYFCLYFIVPYFYFLAPKATRASHEYWKVTRPEFGFWKRAAYVLKHYYRFGTVLLDRIYQSHFENPQFHWESNGFENILNPLREKHGLILLGAHTGGWDIAARFMKDQGHDNPFHLVQYESKEMAFHHLKEKESSDRTELLSFNMEAQSILSIHSLLQRHLPVGMMGDRPVRGHFELVPFFGKLACFDTTAFRIAASTGAPLLFTFGFRRSYKNYDFFAPPSKSYHYENPSHKSDACLGWAKEFASTLEGFLKKYPDQWFNFFRFWSAPPVAIAPESKTRQLHHLIEQANIQTIPAPVWEPDATPTDAPVFQQKNKLEAPTEQPAP